MASNNQIGIYSCIKMLKLYIKIKRKKSRFMKGIFRFVKGIFGFVKGGALT